MIEEEGEKFGNGRGDSGWRYSGSGKVQSDMLSGIKVHGYIDAKGVNPVVLSDGKQSNFALFAELGVMPDPIKLVEVIEKLGRAGAVLLFVRGPLETGYWNPKIVTDEHGQASITITLPEQSTAWQLAAKGITTDTLCGEATTELTASKPLFGELKLPQAFVAGDSADILATIHNTAADAKEPIVVTLKTTIGSKTVEEHKTIAAGSGAISELTFSAAITSELSDVEKRADAKAADAAKANPAGESNATFELTVASAGQSDTLRRVVPIHPYGISVFATAGGSASADNTVWVEAPKEMPLAAPSMQILIGPTVEQIVARRPVLAPPTTCQLERPSFRRRSRHDDERSARGARSAKAHQRDARSCWPTSCGPRWPRALRNQLACILTARRWRLELDRLRRLVAPPDFRPSALGVGDGQTGRLQSDRRQLRKSDHLAAKPGRGNRRNRLRK